jgi:hypothetical protein
MESFLLAPGGAGRYSSNTSDCFSRPLRERIEFEAVRGTFTDLSMRLWNFFDANCDECTRNDGLLAVCPGSRR